MKVLDAKIVCDRCDRLLARIGHVDGRGWAFSVRRHAIVDRSTVDGEPRVTFECPRCRRTNIRWRVATLHRRADAGERIIGV
ncbi:hypothetical protein ACFQ0K_17855 [Nocardioides caeni]|uniref:Uncharacterized protein n=1 Tax=Nocardioides caeni TaxID=574700 RepID=A0A4S8NEG1_9ACTN|nr:hypothetical protein [Nocardioides caeni]THV13369.1 hypothetical protein E9934_10430 [Nocardioides caeni]